MNKSLDNSELDKMINPPEISIAMDEINQMNIIINDNDCSDTFIRDVCCKLEEFNLSFRLAKRADEINYDDAVVITLDQQYNSGAEALIFAPYNNNRLGNSDSLALSMKCALENNGLAVGKILCGQIGYSTDKFGNVSMSKATSTENSIDENNGASFVTISLGTKNINSSKIACSIVEGLARLKYYLDNYDNESDLIYKTNRNDNLSNVAGYFDSEISDIKEYNKITDDSFTDSQAIINPLVEGISSFDEDVKINVEYSKLNKF